MSDWDEFDDDTEGQQSNLLKDLRKQLKDHKKEREELATKLAEAETRMRERTVADVLKAQGVPEKAAKLIPQDIEPTEEAVGKWLDDFGDLFGKPEEKAEDGSQAQPSGAESTVPADVQEQMQRTAQTGAAGQTPSSKHDEQMAAVQKATHEELLQMIANAQPGRAA